MSDSRSALEYLVACSETSLESFRIARMNEAANLRRQVRVLVDQWIEAEVDAGISRWMLECRSGRAAFSALRMDHPFADKFLERIAMSLLPGRVEVSAAARLQGRLLIAPAKAGPVREPPLLLEHGAGIAHDRKKPPEERPPRERKPYAKPFAQKQAVAFLSADCVLPMPGCSR
jgi:hypothetical protein